MNLIQIYMIGRPAAVQPVDWFSPAGPEVLADLGTVNDLRDCAEAAGRSVFTGEHKQ